MAKIKKKDEQVYETTIEWRQYEEGIKYKQSINLFDTIKTNYLFYLGDQWNGVEAQDLPKPVFNFIKQVIRYKVATVMANDTKIIYFPMYTGDEKYDQMCQSVCEALTKYADVLRENQKLDYHNEMLVTDAAVAGSAYTFWRFNKKKKEVEFDVVDVTNIFPGDVNTTEIQKQPYIIISYRRDLDQLKQEARENAKEHLNKLSDDDIENLAGDSENQYESGEFGSKEITNAGKPTKIACLTKLWRDPETDTIHIKTSVKNFVILTDYDLELEYYPVAGMVWETNKNSFYGVSDITSIIPNQKYVNKMAAMIQYSTMLSAIPKAVYDEDLVEAPDNSIGKAIAVKGANSLPVNNIYSYINPPQISPDARMMIDSTIGMSKELMSASDAALGTANTTSASGKAILLQMEASATPLETTRRRFYSYIEDCARIWMDLWRVYHSKDGKQFSITNDVGETDIYKLTQQEITEVKATVRVDVGPCSRYSEPVVAESLDNLLLNKFIPFDWWVEWIPDSLGLPKQDMKLKLKAAKEEQEKAAAVQAQQQAMAAQQKAQQAAKQQAPQNAAPQGRGQPAQQAAKPSSNVNDAQVEQLVQAISKMQPAQAKTALNNLGKQYPEVASKVLQKMSPDFIAQLRAS